MKRFLACTALFLFGLAPAAFAQGLGPDTFMVNPYDESGASRSWILYAAKPGSEIQDTIQITNKTDQSIEFSILGVDATLTNDKGFALRNNEDTKLYVGKWIELSEAKVTVNPGTNVVVPFTIRVPSDAKDGDYWGAVAAHQLTALGVDKASGFSTGWRVGIRTMIQVDSTVASPVRLPQVNEGGSYDFVQALTPRLDEYAKLPPASPAPTGVTASSPSQKKVQPQDIQADITGSSSSLFVVGIVVVVALLLAAVLFGKKKSKMPPTAMIFFLLLFGTFTYFFLNIPSDSADGGLSILPYMLDESGVKISQSWFVLRLAPGETKAYQVEVTNTNDVAVPTWVYPVDATITSDGGFALQSESYEDKDVGSWITMEETEFELPGKGTKVVNFTISIPQNAEVGDHAGGIIVQPSTKAVNLESTGFNIVSRSGVRVYVHVPGETVTKLDVSGISFDILSEGQEGGVIKKGFVVSLVNVGNIRLVPMIDVKITNWYGKTVDTFTHSIAEVPPGQSATIKIPWENLAPGKYTAYLTLKYGGEGNVTEKSVGFVVYPEKEVMVKWGVIALGIIIFLGILKIVLSRFHISFSVGRDKKK